MRGPGCCPLEHPPVLLLGSPSAHPLLSFSDECCFLTQHRGSAECECVCARACGCICMCACAPELIGGWRRATLENENSKGEYRKLRGSPLAQVGNNIELFFMINIYE